MRTRSLVELHSSGDVAWFAPALDLLQSDFFSTGAPIYAARAPGRLDVMGGIADYSGSLVLELPLACSTTVVLQPSESASVDVRTRRHGGWDTFSMSAEALLQLRDATALAAWFAARDDEHWAAYVVGCIQYCMARSASSFAGFRILIDSSVPEGKGVSSSAAIEVATMYALAACCGLDMTCEEIAIACQWVENHIVGAPCGVMDQMTSACGKHDRLLRLNCQPALIEGYVVVPAGYRFYGIDSGLRHAVTGADYGTVRTAAFMGQRILAEMAGSPRYLANIDPSEFTSSLERHLPDEMRGAEFLERYGGITDPVTRVLPDRCYPVRQAAAHPIYENDRVHRFAQLLASLQDDAANAHQLGGLMYESHTSYSACGLGSDGTDRLVELVKAASSDRGVFGAKITGGGSGGTVAILGTVEAEDVVKDIAARYSEETGRASAVFTESGPSACETGVLGVERLTAK